MAKQYKRSHKAYFAWNYEQEIEDLNRASEQGWQLVSGGCFSSKFVKNPDILYRYQMDYQKVEDMGRYIETFREQGWEYVNSTFNGWHYFLDLEIEADKPLTFAVVNAAGEAVYSVTETDFEEEDIRLKLAPGQYRLSISVETGFEVECSLR